MPPENTNPVAKSEVSEFDFDTPQAVNPRLRKRSLKVKPATGAPATEPASATPALSPSPSAAPARPAVYAQPAASAAPASSELRPAPVRPSTGTPSTPAQPEPTGVLYYSNGPHQEPSMKQTPLSQAARPNSASQPVSPRSNAATAAQAPIHRLSSTPQASAGGLAAAATSQAGPVSSAARPGSTPAAHAAAPSSVSRAISTTVAGPASSSKPAGVSDYRSNIERQAREQKSIGGILNMIVYGLIAFFVIGAGLAGYGAHDIYRELHAQSVTVSDLDARYAAANQQLNDQLKVTEQAVIQLQGQLSRAQAVALHQQDALVQLQTALDAQTAALREERATRAAETEIRISETSALRNRIRNLERNEITFHP